LACLDGIVSAHARSIPFENLDVLLGRPISLAPADVARKLIADRRGGYCFEQNSLLLRGLETLGFKVTPFSARVRVGRPRDYMPARTHLFVKVELDGEPWMVDVGVGGLSLTSALRLELDRVQTTPHEPRRIVFEEGRYFHQALLGGTWTDVCEFTQEEMHPIDREVANWFTSAHPQSHFKNRLVVARAGPDGSRVSLLNDTLTLRDGAGQARASMIGGPLELLEILDEHFGLRFPSETRFGSAGAPWPV
jgi:N-hydroxyarylamine O-acetyltransferase